MAEEILSQIEELQEKINKIRERLQRYIDEYIFIHNLKTPRGKELYLEFASNSNPYEISSLSKADIIPSYEDLYFQDFSPIITKSFFNGPPINYEMLYEDSGYPSQENYFRNTINLGHYLNYRNKKDDNYIFFNFIT